MTKNKITALLLAIALLIPLAGCNSITADSKYRITSDGLYKESFAVGFRLDDRLCEVVNAGLEVLTADGTASELSRKWFGENLITMTGDADALDRLREERGDEWMEDRELIIMGFDPGAMPMSFKSEDGEYTGFDIDFARRLCSLLGWDLSLQPINAEDYLVELGSGNVDCVWGGMSFEGFEGRLSVTDSYMKSEKILVTLRDENYTSMKKLSDAVLSTTFDPVSKSLLETSEELKGSFSTVKKLNGVKECFSELDSGEADAILIDSVAAEYYISGR